MLVDNTSMKYVEVGMSIYKYISKECIPVNLKGFITSAVCECVAGIVSSDQGFALFHYFKTNDPKSLHDLIKADFKDATSVKITLIGGNLNNLFSPWEIKDRDLQLKKESTVYGMQEALDRLMTIPNVIFRGCYNQFDDLQKCLKENFSVLENRKCYKYDLNQIDEVLKNRQFAVYYSYGDETSHFIVQNTMDFVGFQNVLAVKNICALFDANTVHYHCPSGSTVFADFDGNFGIIGIADQDPDRMSLSSVPSKRIEGYDPFQSRFKKVE